jgi:predicted PurR-regulated permease PerM
MKYKFLSIIYKPMKYIFNNIIYLIKLSSTIITILSLFNISSIYYSFDIIEEFTNLIDNIINYIKNLINKWLYKEDETPEPIEILHYRKEIKVIEKSIQKIPKIHIGYYL